MTLTVTVTAPFVVLLLLLLLPILLTVSMTVIEYCRAYQKDRNCIQGDFEGEKRQKRVCEHAVKLPLLFMFNILYHYKTQ